MKSNSSKLERVKFFIKHFVEVFEPKCYFCGEKMDWKAFFPNLFGKDNDDWVEHHKDHNHDNNDPKNRTLAHKGCHRSYHRTLDEAEQRDKFNHIYVNILEKVKKGGEIKL